MARLQQIYKLDANRWLAEENALQINLNNKQLHNEAVEAAKSARMFGANISNPLVKVAVLTEFGWAVEDSKDKNISQWNPPDLHEWERQQILRKLAMRF